MSKYFSIESLKQAFNKGDPKKILSDALASNLFCAGMAFPSEVLFAGMDIVEHVRGRVFSIVPNAVSGPVFGKWRDFMTNKLKGLENKGLCGKLLLDGIISGTFSIAYLPVYFLIMSMAEVELDEMLKAAGASVFNQTVTGPIFGQVIDRVRKAIDRVTEVSKASPQGQEQLLPEKIEEFFPKEERFVPDVAG